MNDDRTDWRLEALEQLVRALAPVAAQVAKLDAEQDALDQRVVELNASFEQNRKELREELRALRMTLIGFAFTVAAAAVVVALGLTDKL